MGRAHLGGQQRQPRRAAAAGLQPRRASRAPRCPAQTLALLLENGAANEYKQRRARVEAQAGSPTAFGQRPPSLQIASPLHQVAYKVCPGPALRAVGRAVRAGRGLRAGL